VRSDHDGAGYRQRLAGAVTRLVADFAGRLTDPDASDEAIMMEFRLIGLSLLGEAMFGYLDELAAECARGYAEASEQAGADRAALRRRLLDAILAEPPASRQLIAGLAAAVGWTPPATVAVVVFDAVGPTPGDAPLASGSTLLSGSALASGSTLASGVLADWSRPEPCVLVPDPDGPGRAAVIDQALRGWLAVIGPSVPLRRAAASLRWARQTLALCRRGIIATGPPGGDAAGPLRADRHLSTLLLLADEELARTLCAARLAPLDRLRPGQRDRIAETMLSWLLLGENAAEVAQRIHVHPQTVRYRLRQIHELFGDQLRDPGCRFELQQALRARSLLAKMRPPVASGSAASGDSATGHVVHDRG
jgi:hypothetical protein